ncbi:MAG: energy transducer TonB [Ignavibacteria bacterium]
MEKEKALELIKLEVLGCLDAQDESALAASKQSDKYFPWKGLGEYQSLIALLPISLNLEQPPANLKDTILQKLTKIKEEIENRKPKPIIQEEPEIVITEIEKELSEPKSFSGPIPFKDPELTPPPPVIKERITPPVKEKETRIEPVPIVHKEREHLERVNKETLKPPVREKEEEVPIKKGSSKKTMMIAAAAAFLIIAGVFVYLNFSGGKAADTGNNLVKNVVKAPPENLSSTKNINQTPIVEPVKEENKTIQKNEQPPLPKAPTPIEAPISALEEYKKKEVKKEPEVVKKPETKPIVETKKEVVETKVPLVPPKEEKKIEEEPLYFVAVEDMPEPVGGIQAIQNKIVYPDIAKRAGVKGKVFVLAFVDEQGSVTKTVVQKGLGAGLDEAAEDAIKQTKFKPGMQRGKPVKVQVMIPIVFKLQ